VIEALRAVYRLYRSSSTVETYLAAAVAAVVAYQVVKSGSFK
jgi:hypothetical protein